MKTMAMTNGTPRPANLGAGVGRLRVGEVADRLEQEVSEKEGTDQGSDPDEDEVLDRDEELLSPIDHAGDPGQAVVEGDHDAERRERVEQEVLGDQLARDVPDGREDADQDRAERRRQEARMDLRERFGRAPAAAIESDVREPGRIVVCADEMPEMITAITTSLPQVGAEDLARYRPEYASVIVELPDLVESCVGDERDRDGRRR